jgi:hypothetical protein
MTYALYNSEFGYLSNNQGLSGINLTKEVKEAQVFDQKFDNPSDKTLIWNIVLRMKKNTNQEFQVINL